MTSLTQTQTRHGYNASADNIPDLPETLEDRLTVETIDEAPPGSVSEGMEHPSSFSRLHILCGPEKDIKVSVDYLYYPSNFTFQRPDGDDWYLCHTWTRTWGEEAKSGSVFVNLRTGERHDTCFLSWWRGSLSFNNTGTMALIEAGITGSSASQIVWFDITNLDAIDIIHLEENWETNGSYYFDKDDPEKVIMEYGFHKSQYEHYYLGKKDVEITEIFDIDPQFMIKITRAFDKDHQKPLFALKNYNGRQTEKKKDGLGEDVKTKYGVYIVGESKTIIVNEVVEELDIEEEYSEN